MLIFIWLILISVITTGMTQTYPQDDVEDEKARAAMRKLRYMAMDMFTKNFVMVHNAETLWTDHQRTPDFEIGIIVFQIYNRYRHMVDRYNISVRITKLLYENELHLYFEDIQLYFLEIKHLIGVLHEIENKYKIKKGYEGKTPDQIKNPEKYLKDPNDDGDGKGKKKKKVLTKEEKKALEKKKKQEEKLKKKKDKQDKKLKERIKELMNKKTTTKRPYGYGFPIDYGWWPKIPNY